jgi:L,D-transpeptidase YbiS
MDGGWGKRMGGSAYRRLGNRTAFRPAYNDDALQTPICRYVSPSRRIDPYDSLGGKITVHKIVIDSKTQYLNLFRGNELLFVAPVSTSRFGLGFEPGSRKTPTGSFRVREKIGGEMPIGTVYKGRRPIASSVDRSAEEDLITSRILWLEGLEENNANTKERYIYIHGTNQEHSIGQPTSNGCIRMRNTDVIRLFDLVEPGVLVEIVG